MPNRTYKSDREGIPVLKERKNNPTPSPQTVLRVEEAAKMITDGKSRESIIEYIRNKYSISQDQARKYWIAATHFLIPDDMDDYKKSLIQANISRLEKIIEMGMTDRQNLKIAKEAIAELNKMIGAYETGVQIGVKNGDDGQEFIIKIND